ncbi:MAG: carboxypeptidase-like regulatory domain-containing protein [Planctomycetota bacterium]
MSRRAAWLALLLAVAGLAAALLAPWPGSGNPGDLATAPEPGSTSTQSVHPSLAGAVHASARPADAAVPARLRVTVRSLSGDQPVAGARIRLLDARGHIHADLGTTSTRGLLESERDVPPGAVVEAAADGFASATRAPSITAEGLHEVLLYVEDAHALRGRVVNDLGEPVDGARVVVRAESGGDARAVDVRSQVDGSFVAAALAAGEYAVTVEPVGGAPGPATRVRVPFGSELQLTLPRGAYLVGTVRDLDDGRPLAGALVGVQDIGFASSVRVRTDERGAYRLGPLQLGRAPAYLDVTCRGFRPATAQDVRQVELLGPHPSIASRARLDLPIEPGAEIQIDVDLQRGAVVSGVVRGPDGPVAGALVMAFPADGTPRVASDAEGRYRLDGLSERAFLVRAYAPGLLQPGVPTNIRAADVATSPAFLVAGVHTDPTRDAVVDLELARGAVASVRVVDDADGRPVPGARVTVRSQTHASRPTVTPVDGTGAYEVSGLAAGDVLDLVAVHPDYEQAEPSQLRVDAMDEAVLRLRARSRLVVRGHVRSNHMRTLRGAFVQVAWLDRSGFALDPVGRWKLWQGATRHPVRADGTYEVELVGAPGRFAVRAVALQHLPVTSPDQIAHEGDRLASVDLQLEPGQVLEGVVVDDASGAPVPGAHIVLTSAGERVGAASVAWYSTRATTDVLGAFRIEDLPAGPLRVDVRALGWASSTRLVELPLRDPFGVRLARADGVLAGRVEGEAGDAVAAARVVALLPDQPARQARAGRDGGFRIEGLVRALATVSASAPGRRPAREADVPVGTTDLRLVLLPGALAAGRLADAAGKPMARAWLRFVPAGEASLATWLRTDGDGRFRRDGLPPGPHAVFLRTDAEDVPLADVELPADDLHLVR